MKKYYLRRSLRSAKAAYLVAILYVLAMVVVLLVMFHTTPARLWSLIPPALLIHIGVVLYLRHDTYYYIDEKAYLLYAGNDYGRKPHVVCKFTDLVEVTYLPHTKEVKLTKPGGTDYLKLAKGKEFVDEITEIFERIYPKDGHHTEGAEEATDFSKKD